MRRIVPVRDPVDVAEIEHDVADPQRIVVGKSAVGERARPGDLDRAVVVDAPACRRPR